MAQGASAEAAKAGQTAENCHTMTEEWFGDRAASGVKITANSAAKKPAQSVSGLLDSYFDSRESSYTDHGEVKRKSVKSALAGDTSAFSDAVEAMEERGEFRITDAEITTLYDDSDVIVHEDGTIAVYVYEWVFYDYDDLSDTYRGTDVS